jgi:hypothetical protein
MQKAGGTLSLKNMSVREIKALNRLTVKEVVTRMDKNILGSYDGYWGDDNTYWKLNNNIILLTI